MFRASVSVGFFIVSLGLCVACTTVVVAPTQGPTSTVPAGSTQPPAGSTQPPAETPATGTPSAAPAAAATLLPDPAAAYTTTDTARLSGGEFVGDQADLTVEQAVRLGTAGDEATYAFLVAITGLDDASFHYNSLNFQLIDDQSFQYDALIGSGQQPELDFGDLAPDQMVRGWLTFEAPATTTRVDLQYSPASALEAATFGFLVP